MGVLRDAAYAVRSLSHSPGFLLVVVLTLALGIGANTAVFSVLRGVLLRPLPHRDGDRLVYLRQSAERAGQENVAFSVPEVIDYREASTTLTGFAEFSAMTFNLLGAAEPVQVLAGIVSGNYFDVMGLGAVAGRTFDARDDGPDAAPAMVLTNEYWLRAFGGDPTVIGRTVTVNARALTIVGVLQPAPHFPQRTDVFVNMVTSPHHLSATMVHGRTHRMTEVFARLAPGATVEQARLEVERIANRVHVDHPDAYEEAAGYRIAVQPLREALAGRARLTLYLLMGTAAFVLLIACANVANLTLMRAVRRERELMVRWSLGAGRARLRRLLLVESAVLAAAGAALGLLLAYPGLRLLASFAQRFTPRAGDIHIDGGVLAFTVFVASTSAVVFAFAPSLSRIETGAAAGAGDHRTTGGVARRRVQRALVVLQLALAVVVLTGAGLLARTLVRLNRVDTGVNVENVLTLEVPIEDAGRSRADVLALYEEMRRRIAELSPVLEAGLGSNVPLRASDFMLEVQAEGLAPPPGRPVPRAEYRTASPEYFRAAGIPLLRGREFAATDRADAQRVVILNRTLAERLFPGRDPIGRRVAWTGDVLRFIPVSGDWRTVVGVVGDTRDGGPDYDPRPVMFQPFAQEVFTGAFAIRTSGDAASLAPSVARIIRDLVPDQLLVDVLTLQQIHAESVAPSRLNAFLVGAFATLALLIATIGIAGVLAFSVSMHTAEIGIRMSLGAAPAQVLTMVLAEGAALLAGGLAIGLAGSFAVARLLTGFLFSVAPYDPLTIATAAIVMSAAALAACCVPAAAAARIDPLRAITPR